MAEAAAQVQTVGQAVEELDVDACEVTDVFVIETGGKNRATLTMTFQAKPDVHVTCKMAGSRPIVRDSCTIVGGGFDEGGTCTIDFPIALPDGSTTVSFTVTSITKLTKAP